MHQIQTSTAKFSKRLWFLGFIYTPWTMDMMLGAEKSDNIKKVHLVCCGFYPLVTMTFASVILMHFGHFSSKKLVTSYRVSKKRFFLCEHHWRLKKAN